MPSTLKRPTAWIPIGMSMVALAIVVGHLLLFGTAREPDEGAAAHLFQLLIALQVPLIAFFAFKWLPKSPAQALQVLAMQAVALVAAFAPVFYFKL